MIKKIIIISMFVFLMVAIFLFIAGVRAPIELGKPFIAFLRTCNNELNDFKIGIPEIPEIPKFEVDSGILIVVNLLISLANSLADLINFIIVFVNTIIQLLEFIFIILKNLIIFRDNIIRA